MENLQILSLKGDDHALTIAWSDGVTHRLTWRLLRDRCPCATCRDRQVRGAADSLSGELPAAPDLLPILSPAEAQPLRVTAMKPVGNYAYGIDFSDGHTTGIYSLEYLRELGEEAEANTNRR